MKKRLVPILSILLLLTACNPANAEQYTLLRIIDGDTIVVKDKAGNTDRIRLACIDAPETPHSNEQRESTDQIDIDQFTWGLKAKIALEQLIHKGDRLSLTITDTDLYGRTVAEVRTANGIFVQQSLVEAGLAASYPRYFASCPTHSLISKAESKAKSNRSNIWGDRAFLNPADFRHR